MAVLIQQHLSLWYTSDDDVTTYEANISTVYALVRAGKYIKLVEDRFGEFAGQIVSELLLQGHARVGNLAKAHVPTSSKDINGGSETNHGFQTTSPTSLSKVKTKNNAKERGPTRESLNQALNDLLRARILIVVHESHFRSDVDNIIEAEREVPCQDKWASKLKKEQQLERENKVERKLRDWKYGIEHDMNEISPQRGKKRPREESDLNLNSKRQRLHNSREEISTIEIDSEQQTSNNTSLDDEIVLRVNNDKLDVMIRNQRLVQLTEQCISPTTATVYAELLRQLEQDVYQCKPFSIYPEDTDDEPQLGSLPQIATHKLEALLKTPMNFAAAIAEVDPSQVDITIIDHRKKLHRRAAAKVNFANEAIVIGDASTDEDDTDDGTNDDSGISGDESADPSHELDITSPSTSNPGAPPESRLGVGFSALRQHLLLLCEHPYSFVHHIRRNSSNPEKWAVDFHSLALTLQHLTLTSTLTSRFGLSATRLANILIAKGKLDEKALSAHSLINPQPLRLLLTDLHKAGLFQLQEVPRDASRQPARTFFFWEWNPERARRKVLEDCYAAMTRLIWRLAVEKGKVKALVEKAERSDVIGREEELLGKDEMVALRRWWGVEEKMWGQVARLDDMVAVLRDF